MRTQTINKIIADNGYESYLEIGLGDETNFKNINVLYKVGVDPNLKLPFKTDVGKFNMVKDTSDNFFNDNDNQNKFDIIFIDGLHESEQVERDIVNAYKVLNKGGVILVHDVNPPSEKAQRVPREQVQWTGDVWRAVVGFKAEYGDKIKTGYFDDPYGLFAIYKTGRYAVKEGFVDTEMTYKEFDGKRKELLGV